MLKEPGKRVEKSSTWKEEKEQIFPLKIENSEHTLAKFIKLYYHPMVEKDASTAECWFHGRLKKDYRGGRGAWGALGCGLIHSWGFCCAACSGWSLTEKNPWGMLGKQKSKYPSCRICSLTRRNLLCPSSSWWGSTQYYTNSLFKDQRTV